MIHLHDLRRFPILFLVAAAMACGSPPDPVAPSRHRPDVRVRASGDIASGTAKQILFGDLHVHTTISADAFLFSLPVLQGEGAHPPADACDFARFCSGLDFWSINDHAESISPRNWRATKEVVRQCNAVAGDPANPDLVTFLGWEWSQAGATSAEHYGHKNVIFRDTDEDRVPLRPIAAMTRQMYDALQTGLPFWQQLQLVLFDWSNRDVYFSAGAYQRDLRSTPLCPAGVDVHNLPNDCMESAETPDVLFEKLRQWGFDSIVIPHGTSWGIYAPPGSSWDKQLVGAMHDPERQTLIEVYSGHGNSEEYRAWSPTVPDAHGGRTCPQPTADYEPCCWRAGEIIRSRCGGLAPAECERRVAQARQDYVDAGILGHNTVPGAHVEDWLDCGQCRDCFHPAFNYRPSTSAQYALAVSNFDDPAQPRRFRFGFIASSDNHSARPGTGYKEFARTEMTEAAGACSEAWHDRLMLPMEEPVAESRRFVPPAGTLPQQVWETERNGSFFLTGGLVAVHAEGRDRDSIWQSLKRREVYGTSGDRILLWFDLVNGPGGTTPMGSEVEIRDKPRFRVRAVGARVQLPGCPDASLLALSPARLERLCRRECFHPGDARRRIERLEVVRIRPQVRPGEPLAELIEDPWRRFECPPGEAGCVAEFDDEDFVASGRESIYYVRALQEPTDAVNAGGLRCERDADGTCVKVRPCWADYRTDVDDDCLAPNRERAWSSPIYIREG